MWGRFAAIMGLQALAAVPVALWLAWLVDWWLN